MIKVDEEIYEGKLFRHNSKVYLNGKNLDGRSLGDRPGKIGWGTL